MSKILVRILDIDWNGTYVEAIATQLPGIPINYRIDEQLDSDAEFNIGDIVFVIQCDDGNKIATWLVRR